jgi:hypothetical protein
VEVVPACVALVDATGGEEYMELVRSALLAALEALPEGSLFGLATFSDQVTRIGYHTGMMHHALLRCMILSISCNHFQDMHNLLYISQLVLPPVARQPVVWLCRTLMYT